MLCGKQGAMLQPVMTMSDENPQVRNTTDFWVETLRKRKQEVALKQRYEDLLNVCACVVIITIAVSLNSRFGCLCISLLPRPTSRLQ